MIRRPASAHHRRAFVDSSGFLAILDADDQHHQAALTIARQLARGRHPLYTSNTVIIEAHALILSALGIERAAAFLQGADRSAIRVIRTRARDEELAKQLILRYRDKRFSMTDAISFVVMERLGIRYAFTFDRDFAQYGLTVLTPELLAGQR